MQRDKVELPPRVIEAVMEAQGEKPKVKYNPMDFFVGVCRGVHDVEKCEDCFNYKGGECGFLRMSRNYREDDSSVPEA